MKLQTTGAGVIAVMLLSFLGRDATASTIVGSKNDPYFQQPLQIAGLRAADEGSAFVLGLGANGQVTNISPYSYASELNPPPGLSNVIAISVNVFGALALTSNGTIVSWGNIPGIVPTNLTNVVAVSAGQTECLALQSNGTVVSWGNSSIVPDGLSNVVAISTGSGNYALEANGTIVSWGSGGGPTTDVSNAIAISASKENNGAIALLANGTVVGLNIVAPTNLLPAGVTNTVAIAGSTESLMALQANGTVVAAGSSRPSFLQAVSNVYYLSPFVFDSSTVVVEGDGWPVFTVQPGNQTAGTGGTIYLHARAVASQSISYQWQLNGINIAGATNDDLIITNATQSNAGKYQALITSGFGFASSSVATVTVLPLTRIPILLNVSLLQPNDLIATANASNGAPFALTNPALFTIEASTDLVNWVVLTQNWGLINGGIELGKSNLGNGSMEFYRLLRQ
ncbi:MAG TPA: hypothetical protein VH595_22205 [Verrucomicrobiae bacterium]|jgi:hypothetical protein|nr:hypothetical protein [Verrucomicrobiae bacterium]